MCRNNNLGQMKRLEALSSVCVCVCAATHSENPNDATHTHTHKKLVTSQGDKIVGRHGGDNVSSDDSLAQCGGIIPNTR